MSQQRMFNKSVYEQTLNNGKELHCKTDVAQKRFKSSLCALPLTDHTDTYSFSSYSPKAFSNPLKRSHLNQPIKVDWRLREIH